VISAPALADALADVVGREHLLVDPAALAAASVDGVAPRWLARPGGAEEVSRLLALASAEELAVIPRGSGAGLGLGAPARRVDLVLDCRRLDRVIDYVAEDMVASVGAGMSLATLDAMVGRRGQRLPLDPPGGGSRTIGGVLAANASGPLRFRRGAGRDLLLGVRFVQADGTITWGGARVVKSVTGYDVPKLLVGSLGTLGLIVEATLRLHPVPAVSRSWLMTFADAERAAAFGGALLDTVIEPARVALLSAAALRAVGHGDPARGARAAVAVSLESVEEAVASQGEALRDLARAHQAAAADLGSGFWPALQAALVGPVRLLLAGEPARLGVWLAEVERRAAACSVGVIAVGEAGSGLLWLTLGDGVDGEWLDAAILAPMRAALLPEGGSLVVEHAPIEIRARLDVWGPVDDRALAIMRRLKAEFDPRGILSPGRFVGGL
jgi:glycolate dehydrogenase FAD-binding subunit